MISLGWKVYIRAGHHSTKIHTNPNIITSEEANDRVTACKMTQPEYLRRKGGNKTGMRGPSLGIDWWRRMQVARNQKRFKWAELEQEEATVKG